MIVFKNNKLIIKEIRNKRDSVWNMQIKSAIQLNYFIISLIVSNMYPLQKLIKVSKVLSVNHIIKYQNSLTKITLFL